MAELWRPGPPPTRRTRSIEFDIRRQIRPNPYYIDQKDIDTKIRLFGSRLTAEDLGMKCMLIWNNSRDGTVFVCESRQQLAERLQNA